MRTERELLPCPFCGGAAVLRKTPNMWMVECDNAGCGSNPDALAVLRHDVVAAWNRRAPVDAPAEDGLPALPSDKLATTYTADQMRQYALDAIAADRLARQPVLDEQAATLLAKQKKIQAMRAAGAKMANTMFNLSQRPGECIDAALAASMKEMQVEWDAALRMPASAAPVSQELKKENNHGRD